MNIKFLSWAGYDLETQGSCGVFGGGPPEMDAEDDREQRRVRAKEFKPGMKGRPSTAPSARIIVDDLRPFPGPSND